MCDNTGDRVRKIGFITNKVLGQSLASVIKGKPELEPHVLLNVEQAVLDAQIERLEIVVVDLARSAARGAEALSALCRDLRRALPKCRILLLVSQDDRAAYDTAIAAIKSKIADDYVFYDTSLDYLFAKLAAL